MDSSTLGLRLAAEALGTFLFFFLGFNAIAVSVDIGGGAISALGIAFAFGLGLALAITALGHVSGGHFNPAVSLGLFLDRRLTFEDLLGYWIFQFAGAILASLLMLIPFSHDIVKATATTPSSNGTALFVEITFTAIFVLVILHSTKSDRYGGSALVAIPLTLLMIHFAAIPFSGSSVNPARSLGPALVGDQWTAFWIYVVGPAAGAIIAWIIYTVVIKGDTDFRDDMQALRAEVRPPSTPPTTGAAPPTG